MTRISYFLANAGYAEDDAFQEFILQTDVAATICNNPPSDYTADGHSSLGPLGHPALRQSLVQVIRASVTNLCDLLIHLEYRYEMKKSYLRP